MCKVTQTVKLLTCVLLITCSLKVIAENKLPTGIIRLNGQDAPPLNLESLEGNHWNIDQARGHWVFLHFWASWCGPCRREMPTIQAIVPKFKNSQLEIILVNTAESEDITFGFIGSIAPDLDSLIDTDGQVTKLWQPRGLPSTFFVDPNGKLQYLVLGGRNWNEPVYLNFLKNLIK